MRRWLVLCLILLWPGWAAAYDGETMIGYQLLTEDQRQVYDLIYPAAMAGEEQVALPGGTLYKDVEQAMYVLLYDCPELCAVSREYVIHYYRNEPDLATAVSLTYTMPAERQQQLMQRAAELADGAYGDEFQREVYLHDLLCDLVVYDEAAANQHNAWGALMEGRAVCDGYGAAMSLLLRLSDIPCSMVTARVPGSLAGHAFNIVRVEGSYAWLDATSNDQPTGRVYDYFNLTDQWMLPGYILLDRLQYPACTDESINWHVKTCRMVESADEMELHIFNSFHNLIQDTAAFALRFRKIEDFNEFILHYQTWFHNYLEAANADFSGTLNLFYTEAQQCVSVVMYNEKTIVDREEK